MLDFHLDRRSGLPTYLQLARQVEQALRLGMLKPGDQLPTAKEVVGQLAINPNTVHKAYRELDRRGLVEARPGRGTFVLRGLGGPTAEQRPELRDELARWIDAAFAGGMEPADVHALFDAVMRARLNPREEGPE
ncbi:GntR family transcriptional regulator [Streptomyces fradiae]|uniref:GntR family transcriptional regulator n=1 Tax=Streptomyces fradiae TaxID=1906 RepID=UPI003985D9F0